MLTHTFTEYDQPRITIHEISNNLDLDAPLKLHSYHLIMVEAGHMTVDLNFNIYEMTGNSTLHISAGDIIRNIVPSEDLKGYHIVFSPEFQNEMRTIRKSPINLQLKKEFPYQTFSKEEYEYLQASVRKTIRYMELPSHHYRSIVIKNEIQNLLLDISDKRRTENQLSPDMDSQDHNETIRKRFRALIDGYCVMHHQVNWYAEALKISPDYLSKIIREHDGTSASVWIHKSIIETAKSLLKNFDLSIKEISLRLNFPDQSSFGRFFKSITGQSPKAFREGLTCR
ncbi:MAG: AraC family transcriptional regulator [Bacteroidales bacterium]|nr:AraC family transcriptional regulator [Bacteroidales bacterium]